MSDKTGSLVCRVYVISDEGEEQIVKETADEACISAVLHWIIKNQTQSNDENSK